jgi:predicted ABC-type transport system involved in lysophospholipase L1 biosynthesis ATPase subunit
MGTTAGPASFTVGLTMPSPEVVVALRDVIKDYKSLRPLRVEHLELREAESVALLGFDQTAAEILVNLITGATLPDSGDVDVFGVSTRNIGDPDAWLVEMDRFGILSQRVVLLDAFTVEQNLALPFTLEVEQLSEHVGENVRALAQEVGIPSAQLSQSPASLDTDGQLRVRLGKALALGPRVLLAEHPNATLPVEAVSRFAIDLKALAAARRAALLVMTADSAFARTVSDRTLTLNPATGELVRTPAWRKWFG